MADERVRDPLESPPPALLERQKTLTLSSGKSVVIERWGWRKLWEMARLTGDPDQIPFIARESLREVDRQEFDALPMEDVLAIAAAAVDMNMTAHTGPNLLTLAKAWGRLSQGQPEAAAPTPSKPSSA